MAFWNRGFGRSMILSGEVLIIRLTIATADPENDERLWSIVGHDSHRLREEIAAAVHTLMGPEFDVRSLSFARGSLELLVVVGTLYYAVSRYQNFVESIELLIAQLKRIAVAFFGPPRMLGPVSAQGSWTPGPGLAQAVPRVFDALSAESAGLTVWYLFLSHAAMLAVLLWLLTRGLRP